MDAFPGELNKAAYYNAAKLVQSVVRDQLLNSSTPMGDQERISPYYINTVSSRQAMRVKKKINYMSWLLVDPIPNSPN